MTRGPLPPSQDAFGAALQDFHAGRPLLDLTLERDDGWARPALGPPIFFSTPEFWSAAEVQVLSHVKNGPVLDLGCGAGRHALYFQELGLEVVGIDHSPGAVAVARARGVSDVRLADLMDLPRDYDWEAVLLMCGNIGLAGTWPGTRDLLVHLSAITSPGSVLVFDSVDPLATDDPAHLEYQRLRRERGEHVGQVRLRLRYGDKVTPWWDRINFGAGDVQELVDGTGWETLEHIEDGADHYAALKKSEEST